MALASFPPSRSAVEVGNLVQSDMDMLPLSLAGAVARPLRYRQVSL